MRFGFLELAVIGGLIILFAGPKQLPKLSKAITDSVKSFKKEMKDDDEIEQLGDEIEAVEAKEKESMEATSAETQ